MLVQISELWPDSPVPTLAADFRLSPQQTPVAPVGMWHGELAGREPDRHDRKYYWRGSESRTLQNNGGLSFTHALLAGSPAIDKGNSAGATTDQRNFSRPFDVPSVPNAGDGKNIGAYEFGAVALHIISIVRSGADVVITFHGGAHQPYRLERKLELTDAAWQEISDVTPMTTGAAIVTDFGGANLDRAFYRVRTLP